MTRNDQDAAVLEVLKRIASALENINEELEEIADCMAVDSALRGRERDGMIV